MHTFPLWWVIQDVYTVAYVNQPAKLKLFKQLAGTLVFVTNNQHMAHLCSHGPLASITNTVNKHKGTRPVSYQSWYSCLWTVFKFAWTISSYLYVDISLWLSAHVKVDNLRTETSWHLPVHLVAGVDQFLGNGHVALRKTIVNPKS